MKTKRKNLILIMLLIAILIVGILLSFPKKPEVLSYEQEMHLKVGEKVPTKIKYQLGSKTVTEIIKWENLELEDGSIYTPGTYQGSFIAQKETQKISLVVVDDVAPTIEGVKDITINEHEEIDLLKDIVVKDNSYEEIKAEIKGEYDTTKKGTYSLTYEAKDSSGNIESKPFTLIVKEVTEEKPTNNGIVGTTSKGFNIELKNGVYYIGGLLIANKTYALPSTYAPGGLLNELNVAFINLKEAASKDGIGLNIISGYRSYQSQNSIYNNYVARDGKEEADTYSARPGHSEHQTGLAIDLNSLMFDFGETKEGQWIKHNCYKYGFILRYPEGKEEITGYRHEAWHIRYIGDVELAKKLYNNGNWITLEEYLGITSEYAK